MISGLGWRLAWPLLALLTGAVQVEERPELEGRVLLGDEPLPGIQVVLHRVSADSAGELDSIPTDPDGGFRFRLPGVPDPGERGRVYFASVRHQGILYFGAALSRPIQLDSLYTIQAWDTVAAPVEGAVLPVGVRYLILESVPEGWQVTDLFELVVDVGGTLVPSADGVTWRHPLPAGAREVDPFGVAMDQGEADLSRPVIEDGFVVVRAPLSPGSRQFVMRYHVPELDGLAIPFAAGTGEVELLVQEPVPDLTIAGLQAVEAVEMEQGVRYRHYAGSFAAATVVTIQVADPPFRLPLEWTAVVLALVLAGAGLVAVQRRGGGEAEAAAAAPAPIAGALRQERLLEIARLDESLDSDALSTEERDRLQARRAELVIRLRTEG
jgi:hypothetical protein